MTYAYAESYLEDAMNNLGEAFDYAVNVCGLTLDTFAELFVVTGFADAFGKGNPKVVAGMSGTELVMEVIEKTGKSMRFPEPQTEYDCSPEYWCGWIMAYYQWKTARSFKEILGSITMEEICRMYGTLHEAAEDKFVDTVNMIISRKNNSTRLQQQRKNCGYSQRELSEKSGVTLRTLQQYEIGAKDINKASASAVVALATVLGCKAEDLLEPISEKE